jgi:transcription initiation factor TFIIA small subunit
LAQGHLHTYRFCDNVWTFFLENATFTLTLGSNSETVAVDKAKIIAVAAAT